MDFIQAVEQGDIAIVDRQLDEDVDLLRHVASTRKTCLHSVANAEMAQHLIDWGAAVDAEAPVPGGTALIHALIWGQRDVAEVLAAISLSPGNLRVAAGLGRMQLLEPMWTSAGELTAQAPTGRDYYRPNDSWFAWAPGDDDQEVLDEALIYAATNGRLQAAEYLVARGANVDGLAYETSALIRAVWAQQTEMVEWLLDQGASVNARGWLGGHLQGATALHIAANGGHLDLARLLVDRGADVMLRDALNDATAEGWAEYHNHPDVRDFLHSVG